MTNQFWINDNYSRHSVLFKGTPNKNIEDLKSNHYLNRNYNYKFSKLCKLYK